MNPVYFSRLRVALSRLLAAFFITVTFAMLPAQAGAQVTAFKQAVAEAASGDADIAAYYRGAGYAPLWTGSDDRSRARRAALVETLKQVDLHGLPGTRYDVAILMDKMRGAHTARDMGLLEVALSQAFLTYARDVQTGILIPARIDPGMVRQVQYRDRESYLVDFAKSDPRRYLNSLPPNSAQYRALMKQKLRLEQVLERGGWGAEVPGAKLEPGDAGDKVVALRNRLIAMGYLRRSASRSYDEALTQAVRVFQASHGLTPDGVAGKGTIAEINKPVQARLKSVIVALERERWLNRDLGDRHIVVNQTDFTAKIIENGRVTFETRSVVGKNAHDRRSPEFSDVMEHMIINPSWHVPRSIVTKEYLPQLQNNPNAAGHILLTDRYGRRVNREETDFTQFSAGNFPFSMRQPPGNGNALGRVKFMFPNKHNIYLHDTPQKSLFKRESRAYSHGCIRLNDPFDFAYALLAKQTDDPKGYFQRILKTGVETQVDLEEPVPIHLIYRTAFVSEKGQLEFRRDVYGRDAKIWNALSDAGVALNAVQG